MIKYILPCLAALLCSCASQRSKIERASTLLRANHGQLAPLCAEQFPIRERFISGKEIIKTDTLRLSGQTFPCPPILGKKTGFIRCPDSQKVTKVVTKTDTIERENTAQIAYLNNRLLNVQDRLTQTEESRDSLQKRFNTSKWLSLISTVILCFPFFLRRIR